MDKLLPCPFCGLVPEPYEIKAHKHLWIGMPDYGGGWFIDCCFISMSGETKEKLFQQWNNRKDTP